MRTKVLPYWQAIEILDKTKAAIPVGHIPSHTYQNIPDMVEDLVTQSVAFSTVTDLAIELKEKVSEGNWDLNDIEELIDLILD